MPKTTKQGIHSEFENYFSGVIKDGSIRSNVVSISNFYDTQIKKLLEEIVPEEKEIPENQDWGHTFNQGQIEGKNQTIAEIKQKIKEAGY